MKTFDEFTPGGLALLAVVVTGAGIAMAFAWRSRRRAAAAEPAATVVEASSAAPIDNPARVSPDLSGLAGALASERKGAPGPALRNLLHYAIPPEHRPRLVGLNDAVEVCVRAMQPGDASGCRLGFDPDPNVGAVPLDLDAFHLLLLNLLLNAREAAGSTGHVEVRTQQLDEMALVAVRDDGPGVPAADLERIFEPFFTTKPLAAGLGLTLCRRIASAHGGTISATNVVPRGLEVGVRVPQ
ncbi:MAG TPA: ATP-binding protein [Patescibacteria group bacterium]|nr:ATP-binding protein [Patescibacteria group bacterium]